MNSVQFDPTAPLPFCMPFASTTWDTVRIKSEADAAANVGEACHPNKRKKYTLSTVREPVPEDFANPHEFTEHWVAWRISRDENNLSVRRSRNRKRAVSNASTGSNQGPAPVPSTSTVASASQSPSLPELPESVLSDAEAANLVAVQEQLSRLRGMVSGLRSQLSFMAENVARMQSQPPASCSTMGAHCVPQMCPSCPGTALEGDPVTAPAATATGLGFPHFSEIAGLPLTF